MYIDPFGSWHNPEFEKNRGIPSECATQVTLGPLSFEPVQSGLWISHLHVVLKIAIVTYENPLDAVEKARYLMDHPKEREEISRRGHQRAWKDHTSSVRAKQFAEILQHHA